MAEQAQPATISAAFPAPPPFYKSFTPQNLERLQQHLESDQTSSPSSLPPNQPPIPDLLSLPPELRTLLPPPLPSQGKYRSFGALEDISSPAESSALPTPTPARLYDLTHRLLLTFLALTHALATNPSAYGAVWDQLHQIFQDVHGVINGYRPHQARETLMLMMEEQVERVRGESRGCREAVGRARGVLEALGRGEGGVSGDGFGVEEGGGEKEGAEKRVWDVVGKEVGGV